MEKQKITLSRARAQTVLHAVQGEANAQTFCFSLLDSRGAAVELTDDMTAAFYVDKEDGNPVQIAGTVNVEDQTIDVPLTLQATAAAGNHTCLLQVYSDDADIWRGDLTLSVTPNPASAIPSRPEFQRLTAILQDAERAKEASDYCLAKSEAYNEMLDEYTEGISPVATGTIKMSPYADTYGTSCVAYDSKGNLMLLDCYNYGAGNTKISINDGQTWEDAPLSAKLLGGDEVSANYQLCIGGDRFLCLGQKYLLWVDIESNSLYSGERYRYDYVIAHSLQSNVTPAFSGGRYIKGKYWVFRNAPSSGALPPVYFTGDRAEYVTVPLPNSNMVAHDITYDRVAGTYYMVGGYDPYGESGTVGWLLKSDNASTWEIVQQWMDDQPHSYKLSLQGNILNIFCKIGGGILMHRLNTDTGDFDKVMLPMTVGGDVSEVLTTPFGTVAVGYNAFSFAADGTTFESTPYNFGESDYSTTAAAYGRKLILANGPQYQIYRVDLVGATMLRKLEQANQLLAELQAAAGKKIVYTDTDPGEGTATDEPEGTILLVFDGAEEVAT